MMKRKLLAVVLPLVGCATVVGSGFAAWYFGDSVSGGDDAKFGAAVNITTEVGNENTTLTGSCTSTDMPDYLILDQAPAKANGSVNDIPTQGIAFTKGDKDVIASKEEVNPFVFSVQYNGGGKTLANLYTEGKYRVRVEIKIDLTALKGYVDLASTAKVAMDETTSTTINPEDLSFKGKDNIYTATYTAPTEDTSTAADWTFTLDLSTSGYKNKLLKYADGMKPTSHEEYAAMTGENGIGTGAKINITATAYLEIDDPTVGA